MTKLQSITPDAEVNIVEIARVSSTRVDKKEKPEGLIKYLINNKHWSPFEHSYMTVEIQTSKAIGIQLLRHRSFTFQELSQRYARVSGFEKVELRRQAEKNRQSSEDVFDPLFTANYREGKYTGIPASEVIDKYLDIAARMYDELIDLGVAKECARMILPMCTSTTIYMTGSVRSWIHFLAIRDDAHAQKEVQVIAKEIKQIFVEQLPIISKALGYGETEGIDRPVEQSAG